MNGGVESGEAAIKIARKWGYEKKGVPENEAQTYFLITISGSSVLCRLFLLK